MLLALAVGVVWVVVLLRAPVGAEGLGAGESLGLGRKLDTLGTVNF